MDLTLTSLGWYCLPFQGHSMIAVGTQIFVSGGEYYSSASMTWQVRYR